MSKSEVIAFNNSSLDSTSSTHHAEELALVALLSIFIIITVIGNTLVILAVLTTRRLRTVTNCFVMSLAVADWMVGVFVMPPAVVLHLTSGVWELGWILCDIWISLDILLCTASILSLCAISVDRYLAVTQPLSYSRKRRSKRLALGMILAVWLSSALITCPPIFGWYEPGKHKDKHCRYNRNTGYVIFSAMGSFFIPMVVMVYVYARISCVVAQRHDQLSHIENRTRKFPMGVREESEVENRSTEGEEPNIRSGKSISSEPLNQRNGGQSRSLRSTYSYNAETTSPHRTGSLYAGATFSTHKNHLDIHLEPASRVSSFRRETKTAQTLSIVVGGFIACWLPFFVFYLLTPFLPSAIVDGSVVMGYLTWLGWINSAMNPFIYAFYSPDFRIAFWRLTCKHFTRSTRVDLAYQHK